ncbi:PLP-dependent aminotransferase family protein [Brevibacillus sp. SYSU BS000544]|uniref:aminotransferase-like domain-containing protein n=1 Tax=Brevibacillus sp. SYSU BS000544 TaxID=3416443 RepID=UPI003CE54029
MEYVKREQMSMLNGSFALREAISQHIRRTRGIQTTPDEIVIVNGSMQAIAILTHLLINPSDSVVMENPCYAGIEKAVSVVGGVPVFSDVDQQGMQVNDWDARLLFVTPNRQFPTGAVLSLDRRQQLLQWAMKNSAMIVEDDYDSEFRHKGRPIESLKVLDNSGVVIYIGSFSKTLLQDLRIGYAILPSYLVEPFVKAMRLFEPYPSSMLEQSTLAKFMSSGMYERHLRKLNRVYRQKYEVLQTAFKQKLSSVFTIVDADVGTHLYAIWNGSMESYQAFRAVCRKRGYNWTDATANFHRNSIPSACFGFTHLTLQEIEEGVEGISTNIDSIMI